MLPLGYSVHYCQQLGAPWWHLLTFENLCSMRNWLNFRKFILASVLVFYWGCWNTSSRSIDDSIIIWQNIETWYPYPNTYSGSLGPYYSKRLSLTKVTCREFLLRFRKERFQIRAYMLSHLCSICLFFDYNFISVLILVPCMPDFQYLISSQLSDQRSKRNRNQ